MKKIITVILSMTALTLLLASVTVTAKRYATVSEVYLRYKDRADLQVSFVKDYRIDDSTTVDVTTLTARDSASWEKLLREMNYPEEFIDIFFYSGNPNVVSINVFYSERNHPERKVSLHDDVELSYVVVSSNERAMYVFNIESVEQAFAIERKKLKEAFHDKP